MNFSNEYRQLTIVTKPKEVNTVTLYSSFITFQYLQGWKDKLLTIQILS